MGNANRSPIRFTASGILGDKTYTVTIKEAAALMVGPNGTGKSTFLSLFYLFLSRQWSRLLEYDFERLSLQIGERSFILSKADLIGFDERSSSSANRYLERLNELGLTDLIYKERLSKDEREKLSNAMSVPLNSVPGFRQYIRGNMGMSSALYNVDAELREASLGQILYLPTYRRIEKDIQSIFPDIESRLKARLNESSMGGRSGSNFREIAGFGMSDISALVERHISKIRDYQRQASETASQEYIRDIVRGRIKNYSLSNLRNMPDREFEDFKNQLDEKLFSATDRENFRDKITNLRKRSGGQPNAEFRYLGMFVEKLLAAHQGVKEKEKPLRLFMQIVSKYLEPEKRLVLGSTSMDITLIRGRADPIPLEKLSSGEKQIVSIFAYLLLSDENDFIVFIDEPELSLSVPWQKSFLVDILSTHRCAKLVAVTHSPFVFDNELRSEVIDVRRLRTN